MYNKSFKDWRSQGQIVTTLYEHDKNHSEKLILLPVNKFCYFDNESNANVFKILYIKIMKIVLQLKKYDIQEMKLNVRLNIKIL